MALGIAVDANRYSDFCRGDESSVRVIRTADRVVLPFSVLAELRAGFRCGARSNRNERLLTDFLQSPRVEVVYADEATTHFYAILFAELRQAGTPIPTNDLWVAALVLQHDLVLFSRDRHFDQVPRIPRV
jgi:tRNA(fMet)-specific endonuclease VapC